MDFQTVFQLIKDHKQEHLLDHYDTLTYLEQKDLLAQIVSIDWKLLDLVHNYLFRIDKLRDSCDGYMPVHMVDRKIPYMNEHGKLVNPEVANGYKFESLVLDMIHLLDSCLPYEVDRNSEFAPIKNLTGADSLESARIRMKANGIQL